MATTLAYIASLCTRKYTSSANAKNDVACQEFYDSSYNYVGIISFPGLNLENKVITEIWLDIDAEKAGYGVKNTKSRSSCSRPKVMRVMNLWDLTLELMNI